MSSTNKTTYYDLPQFVDNDIFNPLVDDNDAYSKIDTALHNIANAEADDASEIVGIKSRLDSAEGDIDTLEAQNGNNALTTTAQTLSGAVNELDADVSALDGRLDIVEDDINNASTGLKVKVGTLETTVGDANSGIVKDVNALKAQNGNATLTTTSQTLSGAVNELNNTLDSMDYKYAVFIGDSYTGATSLGADIDKRYSTKLATKLGLTEKNYAVGGSGFIAGTPYPTQVDNAVSDFTNNNLDFNKVKYFIIGGTRNDKNTITYSTYNTAIRSTLYKIVSNFPKAKIIILALLYDAYYMPQYYLRNRAWMASIISQYPEINKGVTIIDCYRWLQGSFNDILYQNGANVHPTITGHSVIAEHAYSAIMGNNYATIDSGAHNIGYFINTGVNRTNSHYYVCTMDNYVEVDFQIDITDYTLVPADTTLFSFAYTTGQIGPFYMGTQKVIRALNNGVRLEFETEVNKTGDNTGTATVTVKNLDGFTANGTFISNFNIVAGVFIDPNHA